LHYPHAVGPKIGCSERYTHYKGRMMYNFRFLFTEVILSFALCEISGNALRILYFFYDNDQLVATVFSTLYDCFYEMIMPLETCCLVERLTATLCFQSYEKNRKWFLLALSQPFCVGVAFLSNYIKRRQWTFASANLVAANLFSGEAIMPFMVGDKRESLLPIIS
uniref:G protein-coupled receptor n=1 Tax=Haemonchus placei TaxID=6290 RepID=A0A0N4VSA9_HAEPC